MYRRTTADQLSLSDAAAAMDAVFANYVTSISWAPDMFENHVRGNDGRLDASPVWYDDDGAVVAAAIVALRGDRSWIGGFGVSPTYRGRGIATKLLDDCIERARELGAATISLEVLQHNPAAIATYRRGGFREARELLIFEATATPAESEAFAAVEPSEVYDRGEEGFCWQAEPATLKRRKRIVAMAGENAFALYARDPQGKHAQTARLDAPDATTLAVLANAIAAREGVEAIHATYLEAGCTTAKAAEQLGWPIAMKALEMKRSLLD